MTRNNVSIWWNGRLCLEGKMSAVLAHANLRHMVSNFSGPDVPYGPTLVDIHNAFPGDVLDWEYGDETGYARVHIEVID